MREREVNEEQYTTFIKQKENASATKSRLDLNDLLKKMKDQKKDDRKINLLIISGATSVVLVFILILSL